MSQARPSAARCLAGATSPLLPFLAPRALIKPPLGRTLSPWTFGTFEDEREWETTETRTCMLNSTAKRHSTSYHNVRSERQSPQDTPFLGISRGHHSCRFQTLSPLCARYAEIYSFTRGQMRTHATQTPNSILKNSLPPRAGEVRRYADRSSNHRDVSQRGNVLAESRRNRLLHKTKSRLDNLKSYNSDGDEDTLMYDGRYRNLQRRLYNCLLNKEGYIDTGVMAGHERRESVMFHGLAALDRRIYPGIKRACHYLGLRHDKRCEKWVRQLFEGVYVDMEDRLYHNWMSFEEELKDESWDRVLLYLVDRSPVRALQFLRVLGQEPQLSSLRVTFIADTFEHVAKRLIQGPTKLLPEKHRLLPVFWHTIGPSLRDHPALCSQDLLLTLMRLASEADLKTLFDHLISQKVYFGYDTLLHYANKFGSFGNHKYALRCLQRIVEMSARNAGILVARKRFRWSCALILRKSLVDAESYHMTSNIVAEFLKMGLKLDTLLYNVVMHNAMETGDHATAFKVYGLLEKEGLKPDAHTYSIMLHGCAMMDEPAMFTDFAEHCLVMAKELKDPWLATDYLFFVFRAAGKDADVDGLARRLFDIYSDVFKVDPLSSFGVPPSPESSGKLEPPPAAVFLILQAFINRTMHVSSHGVWKLYHQFVGVIKSAKYPILNRLGKGIHIWNAFLLAFCQKSQFANASSLIKSISNNDPAGSPQPDIYSWNMFMSAFFKTDQVEAAERVFQIMRSRGVEPDQFTFGVLVRAYAKAQHVEKLGEVIPMLDAKTQLDSSLLAALARVQQRRELMLKLEKARVVQEQERRSKLQSEQEQQEQRWAQNQTGAVFPSIEHDEPANISLMVPPYTIKDKIKETLTRQQLATMRPRAEELMRIDKGPRTVSQVRFLHKYRTLQIVLKNLSRRRLLSDGGGDAQAGSEILAKPLRKIIQTEQKLKGFKPSKLQKRVRYI